MIIAVDFDGTIVEHDFPRIGRSVPGAIEWLKIFQSAGARLILYTMRSDGQKAGNVLTQAVQYCTENGLEFWGINRNPEQDSWTSSPKCYAELYIDDAAFGCPLIGFEGKIISQRPYADWSIIGPKVMKMIEAENK